MEQTTKTAENRTATDNSPAYLKGFGAVEEMEEEFGKTDGKTSQVKKRVLEMFPRASNNSTADLIDEVFKAICERLRQEDVYNSQVEFAVGTLEKEWKFEGGVQ